MRPCCWTSTAPSFLWHPISRCSLGVYKEVGDCLLLCFLFPSLLQATSQLQIFSSLTCSFPFFSLSLCYFLISLGLVICIGIPCFFRTSQYLSIYHATVFSSHYKPVVRFLNSFIPTSHQLKRLASDRWKALIPVSTNQQKQPHPAPLQDHNDKISSSSSTLSSESTPASIPFYAKHLPLRTAGCQSRPKLSLITPENLFKMPSPPALGALGMTFTAMRGMQFVSLITIIGITANFISEMVTADYAAPSALVGTLVVVSYPSSSSGT